MSDTFAFSREFRHQVCCKLADVRLRKMTDSQLVAASPMDYGPVVTDDHRLFVWDQLYTQYWVQPEDGLWFLAEHHGVLPEPVGVEAH